ncbi:MAG: Cell shape-determining protein MreC [Candidatus Uhrbacteria bacterium GW2011_GWA2_52_8d]|uniref:Cell shape-determining protein MreC n=1 Tax=Candidatus Uhrbacteria bacterium GW2011_GWA2_52_8d TaxID=1618979 RepID=A0A0G1XLQ8_9BACT|nr:MAG: Cell shape-determining protein MreC [Candidatus Uhrbacteria bacterium GW2011_GWA2_52_8d]
MKSRSVGKTHVRRLVILTCAIMLTLFLSFQGLVTTLLDPLATPAVRAGTWISEKMFWWRKSASITAQELEDLYDDRRELAVDAQEFEQLKQENQTLKEELAFVTRSDTPYLAAQILAKSVSYSVSRFSIDVGSDEGVRLGAAVVSGDGIFVGQIVELGEHSATVSAITDPAHALAVSLLNESRTIGVATGSIGDLLRIDFIPTDELIKENDLVVTSGLEPLIPSGLLVGVINAIQQQTGSPFQQAIVEPLSNIRHLSFVLVLTSPDTQP